MLSKLISVRAILFETLRGGGLEKNPGRPPYIFFRQRPRTHIFIFCFQFAPPEDLKWNSPKLYLKYLSSRFYGA